MLKIGLRRWLFVGRAPVLFLSTYKQIGRVPGLQAIVFSIINEHTYVLTCVHSYAHTHYMHTSKHMNDYTYSPEKNPAWVFNRVL